MFYKIFNNVHAFYQENRSHDIQEPICFLYKVQFVDIPPIHPLTDWKYPQMYQHDWNIYYFSCVAFVWNLTYLDMNAKIWIMCQQMNVAYE